MSNRLAAELAADELRRPPVEIVPSLLVTESGDTKRWSLVMAFLVGWLLPRTTARRLAHVGLLRAFVVPVVSGMCVFFAFAVCISWMWNVPLNRVFADIINEYQRYPDEFMMRLAVLVAAVETALFGLALILLPWGARDERVWSSLRNSIRAVWLQTPQIAVACVLVMFVEVILNTQGRFVRMDRKTWYLRHADELSTWLMLALAVWVIWGLVRAVGARPKRRRGDADAICQCCGYNLSGTPSDGRCSECGELVANSIAAKARPGSVWQRRKGVGTWAAWQCGIQSILHPQRLGRELQVYLPTDDSWKQLMGNGVLSAVVATFGVLLWFDHLVYPRYSAPMAAESLWFTLPMAAFWAGLAVMVIASVAALLVGLWFAWSQGCNVMPAAARIVCHTAGYLTLWACYTVVVFFGGLLMEPVRSVIQIGRISIDVYLIIVLSAWSLHVAWLWIYGRLVYMAVREARFATQ